MARKNNAPSTRERYYRWVKEADALLAEIDEVSKSYANNASRKEARCY